MIDRAVFRSTLAPFVAMVLSLCFTWAPYAASEESLDPDVELTLAVETGDLARAEELLDAGADPNADVGRYPGDAALCRATARDRSELLELLLRRGGDVNRWYVRGGVPNRTPLVCAIGNGNLDAFERLLALGAEPDLSLCPSCVPLYDSTPFTIAVYSTQYAMMWRLVELGVVRGHDIDRLVRDFENTVPLLEEERLHPDRPKLIAWLREQGRTVNPKEPIERPSERR